jgi:uncharacterized protein YjbJ (UPF0337 family)
MEFNKNIIKGKWKELKGNLQKTWGKLTDDELEQTGGDVKAIGGIVQQKYGESEDSYNKKFEGIYRDLESKKDEAVENFKDDLKTRH